MKSQLKQNNYVEMNKSSASFLNWDETASNITRNQLSLASVISSAIENKEEENLEKSLQGVINSKNDEIQKVCSSNYIEFVGSVQKAVKIRSCLSELQANVSCLNDSLTEASKDVLEKSELYMLYQTRLSNVDQTISSIKQYRKLISSASRVNMYVQNEKFYHALKLLDRLEFENIRVENNEVSKFFYAWVDDTRALIKKLLFKNSSKWLQDARKACFIIGEKRLAEVNRKLSLECVKNEDTMELQYLELFNSNADVISENKIDRNQHLSEIKNIISPIVDILQIFDYMNELNSFQKFYHQNRKPQIELQALLGTDLHSIKVDTFISKEEEMFKKLVGVITLEIILSRNTGGILLSESEVESLCKTNIEKLCSLLCNILPKFENNSEALLMVKDHAISCAFALGQELPHSLMQPLFEVFHSLRNVFRYIRTTQAASTLKSIVLSDSYELNEVTTEDYNQIMAKYGLTPYDLEDQVHRHSSSTNVQLPFTDVVLTTFVEFYTLIEHFKQYRSYLMYGDWERIIFESVNDILLELDECYRNVINHSDNLSISQGIQVGINASYLLQFSKNMEQYIIQQVKAMEYQGALHNVGCTFLSIDFEIAFDKPMLGNDGSFNLNSRKRFEKTASHAQDLVCDLVIRKIDALLSSVCFVNWTPSEISNVPHSSITDLIEYLQVTFSSFSTLPKTIKESVYFASCTHICASLMDVLCDSQVKKINMFGLYNLRKNLDALINFADNCCVLLLKDCFSSLDELLNFFLLEDIEKILDPDFRSQKKYQHLTISNVIAVLEKYKENNVFGKKLFTGIGLKKSNDDQLRILTKVSVDNVLKKLNSETELPIRQS